MRNRTTDSHPLRSGRLLRLSVCALLALGGTGPLLGCGGGGGGGKEGAGAGGGSEAQLGAQSTESGEASEKAREAAAKKREELELGELKRQKEAAERSGQTQAGATATKKKRQAKRSPVPGHHAKGKRGKQPSPPGESSSEAAARKRFAKEEAAEQAAFKKRERAESAKKEAEEEAER